MYTLPIHSPHIISTVIFALVVSTGFVSACGDSSESDTPSSSSADVGTDSDTHDTSEEDTHTPDAPSEDTSSPPIDPCSATLTWERGPDLGGSARDHHATFITQGTTPHLHVVGGTNYSTIYSDHWSAPIQDDGSLGPWIEDTPLPSVQAGQGVARVQNHTFLISGRNRSGMIPTVFSTSTNDDGSLSPWREDTPLPEARFHNSTTTWGRHIYVSGGLQSDGTAQNSLYHTTVQDDGTLAPWDVWTLSEPISHHASFVHENHLYLALGFSGNPFQDDTTPHKAIRRAPILDDGSLGEFEEVVQTSLDLATMASTHLGECTLLFGGLQRRAGEYSYRAQPARIRTNTDRVTINAVPDSLNPLSIGRSHMHHAPFHNGFFYVVGGSQDLQDVTNAVEIGTFQAP